MNFVYLGSSRPEELTEQYRKMGSRVNFAGQTLQDALLTGFSECLRHIKIITSWDISPYPKVKKVFFKKERIEQYGSKDYVFVGALNLPIINLFARFIKSKRELKRQLSSDEKNVVFIYEMHSPFLLAATSLKNRIDHISLIVPDLPQFMSGNSGFVHGLIKRLDAYLINKCLKKIDSYVLLSEHMREKLPIGEKPWMVMEGIFHNTLQEKRVEKDEHKCIMYTGGAFRRRGLDLLVEAFKKIKDPSYRLWIRGDGDMSEEINKLSKVDSRVRYFPPMDRAALLELEQKATVMVNPTQPSLDFTRYFFPSKTMEYLATGTPTVMFHLGCMPTEYDDYLYYVEEESMVSLRDKLVEVCEKPDKELYEFGQEAKNFILKHKNPQVQCQRIIDFINEH